MNNDNNDGGKKPPVLTTSFATPSAQPVPLTLETLRALPKEFKVPAYDPADVKVGIFHIGPSNFARSHLGKIVDEVLHAKHKNGEPLDLGIQAVSLKTANVKHDLMPQDGLYTLTSKGAGKDPQYEVIGSVRDVICAKENGSDIIEAAANPNIKIMTMTVTQKGYTTSGKGSDASTVINTDDPEFSTIGVVVHSLKLRHERGLQPPVIMSCDNVGNNGTMLRNAVIEEASKIDPLLAEWIHDTVPFPSTMVDRITPSKSDQHVTEIHGLGVADKAPVLAEPMPHVPLVIQDLSGKHGIKGQIFRDSGIQQLGGAKGVIFSPHVEEYEKMKLRMLNGAHMALGCVGTLAGYKTTDEAMKDPLVRGFVSKFMDQVIKTLEPIQNVSFQDFKDDVLKRLDNPHIRDPLTRLARNGISKMKDRLLDTARDAIAHDKPSDCITFAAASWLQYAGRLDAKGFLPGQNSKEEPNDALAEKTGIPDDIKRNRHTITALFDRKDLWGKDLADSPKFIDPVVDQFNKIELRGIKRSLEVLVGFGGGNAPPAPTAPFPSTLQ